MRTIGALTALTIAASVLWSAASAFAAQNALVTPPPPLSMSSLASYLNSGFLSVGSFNAGSSAPANGPSAAAFSYEAWFNTSSNPSLLEITADGTHWSVVGSLNTSTFVWTPYVNGSPITSIATLNVGTGLGSGSGNLNLQPAALSTIGGVEAINAVSHEWISYIDTSGVPHLSQPACGDLSNAGSGCSAMIANYLPLAGGTMSGGIAMGSNSITGLSGLTLNNNDYIQWKDTGGTARNVLALDYNNNVALYAPSGGGIGFEVNAGTVALNLDSTGVTRARMFHDVADPRSFGTVVCAGSSTTGLTTAIAAAQAAGYKYILVPDGCEVDQSTFSTEIHLVGENWLTSGVSAGTSGSLSFAGKSTLDNLYYISSFCYNLDSGAFGHPSSCPIHHWSDSGDAAEGPAMYPYQDFGAVCAPATWPGGSSASPDVPCMVILQVSAGDGLYVSNFNTGNAINIDNYWNGSGALGGSPYDTAINISSGNNDTSGAPHVGIHIHEYTSDVADAIASIVLERSSSTAAAHQLFITDINAGGGSFTNPPFEIETKYQTGGALVDVYHEASTFSGDVFLANMANSGGSFTGNFLDFLIGGSSVFKVTNAGGLDVGTSSEINYGLVSIAFSTVSNHGIDINNTNASSGALFAEFLSNGSPIGSIANNSNTGVLYNVTSDARLKYDPRPLTKEECNAVDKLHPQNFAWQLDGHREIGFLAQQEADDLGDINALVGAVSPGDWGQPSDPGFKEWQRDDSRLVSLLVCKIQEEERRFQEEERRIATLEAQLLDPTLKKD